MIKVQDWIASIPDSEKHIAYVGEGKSEQREFLLCGDGWEHYKNCSFHLDMAFDPTSITTHDCRQVVQTTHNSTEQKEEAGVIVDEVTKKETFTIDNVQTTAHNLTDIAPLSKTITADGIRLTWSILRQHTVLPGKLWATIRAVNDEEQRIKKSAIMVFEVDPAICAVSAAVPPISEFEQMEMQMDAIRMLTEMAADTAERASSAAVTAADEATRSANTSTIAADTALGYMWQTQQNADQVAAHTQQALAAAQAAEGYAVRAEEAAEIAAKYNRVSVRDYGAVGDGVADDRAAIVAAFTAAKSMLPCEVYFPAGTYGISNGITVQMKYGTGGLCVRGAGRDITTIKYLDSYDPDQPGNMWYAIRIWPEGMPSTAPTNEDEWLHDISYTGFTVYDPDPCAHAWNTAKGDSASEETHGIDIQYCKGVSVTDCQFITVGDEAMDICFCHDVVVMNNRLIGSPGAGNSGGGISIGGGCKGVVVCGNTVNGSAPDETLDDGTVITKSNYGIAVESLFNPVQDVTITGNTIRNTHGKGINLGATNAGASITNVLIANNVISGCDMGICFSGALPKDNIKITDNLICDCAENALLTSHALRLTFCGNTVRNIKTGYALDTAEYGGDSIQLIADNVFENIERGGLRCKGNVVVKDCVFYGIGTSDTSVSGNIYGVYNYDGIVTVSGCTFKDVRMAMLKACLHNVDYIDNTDIEVVNKNTGVVDGGGTSVSGTKVKRIIGCSLIGNLTIWQDNAIVQGNKITQKGSAHAITVSANGVSVTGCVILADNGSYRAISESSDYNHNLFANNVVNRPIVTAGAQSVAANNIDTRVTA